MTVLHGESLISQRNNALRQQTWKKERKFQDQYGIEKCLDFFSHSTQSPDCFCAFVTRMVLLQMLISMTLSVAFITK